RVTVETVAGAEVAISGRTVGIAPLPPIEVEAGAAEIRVQAEGYEPATMRVEILGMGAAQTVKANLVPRRAKTSLGSVPPGSIASPQGRLVVRSTPPGAAVTIDDAYRGETPLTVDVPPGRPHALRVSKAAHETATAEVSLGAGEEKVVDVALEARLGEVEVTSRPPDAEVFVNGESRGRAGQTLKLEAEPQEIEVRREGFVPHKETITPRPGYTQALRVTLLSLEESRQRARPGRYKAAGGPELVLVEGGRLVMGASRREPGRRANETLRKVALARPFYVGLREVTNHELRLFKADHSSGFVARETLDRDEQPAVNLTWDLAAEYCNWLSAKESLPPVYRREGARLVAALPLSNGYRLPTEAEWELVARRGEGGALLKYPWGAALPVAPGSGNYADASARTLFPGVLADYQDRHPVSAPVGSFPPNALGLFDLGGNVAEWAHDLYSIPPASQEEARDPAGPKEGEQHVIRGSSFMHASVTELRLSFRDYGTRPRPDLGFRVARYAE
ncbi:MAG TPA: SUMF1/EgtB/PvdO family nonheme iron enzyme, partial [Vicinamibacteria bacterium]|nr:SUMF1/EgtB/PvdO family nonheme iron enzyme [Vicinamibacteria bacterium]